MLTKYKTMEHYRIGVQDQTNDFSSTTISMESSFIGSHTHTLTFLRKYLIERLILASTINPPFNYLSLPFISSVKCAIPTMTKDNKSWISLLFTMHLYYYYIIFDHLTEMFEEQGVYGGKKVIINLFHVSFYSHQSFLNSLSCSRSHIQVGFARKHFNHTSDEPMSK